ncbi:unnamed protein product [Umbelopsis ramanniana]
MLAGLIFSKDGNDSFMEVNYIGGYVLSSVFLGIPFLLADACAINNAAIDIINSRYVILQDEGPTDTEFKESDFYTRIEISWAIGSAASRYGINADTVFRILAVSLTLEVSDALIEVFCQDPVCLQVASIEVMKTLFFVDATNNLTSELRSRVIENIMFPGWLPARYVLTPIVRTSTLRSETWSSCDMQTGKTIALFMDRDQDYSDEKEDIIWSKLGVEKNIVFPVVFFNIIMLIILVAALYSAISSGVRRTCLCWIGDGAVEADNYLSSDVQLWSYYECGVIELGTRTTGGGYRAVMVQITGEMLTMEHIELSGFSTGQAHVTYDIDGSMADVTLGFLQRHTWNMPIGATKEGAGRSTMVSNARRFNAMDVASRVYNTIRSVNDQHGQHLRPQRSD